MDRQLILVMLVALAIVLPIVGFIIHIIDRRNKAKNNIGVSLANKYKKNMILLRIYDFFSRFTLTRQYVDKIRRRYEILYPGEINQIKEATIKTVLASWTSCILAIYLIFLRNPNFNNMCVSLILVYVINNEILSFMINRTETRLLEDLINFISDVRHNYYVNRMVDDAVLNSMNGLRYEMKVHANKIYEVLISNNIKEDVTKYNTTTHNKYLKMFLSLCISVLEYSDKKVNGQFLFTQNLENLKKEINIEILKQKKLRFLFSGITFVTMAAVVPIDWIRNFGVSMMEELGEFYNGKKGTIYVAIVLIVTIIIYIANSRLKETKQIKIKDYKYLKKLENFRPIKRALDNYTEKNYGKIEDLNELLKRLGESISPRQLILQRIIVAIVVFVISILFMFFLHETNQKNITTTVSNINEIAMDINPNQHSNMIDAILKSVDRWKDTKGVTREEVFKDVVQQKYFSNTKINERITDEVVAKVNQYQNEYFKWYELAICYLIALIGFCIPYWMILFKKRILLMNMEDEVNQFNSIIYMLMYIDHLTVKDLLEELEMFAVVFKRSLQECINDYNSGEMEALMKLKENEKYPPFQRLVDNFIRCDSMSIEKAFDEISSDRENYHDRRKQENEISIQRRANIAKPLSWVPVILVMIYLMLPMTIASINELNTFSQAMQNM